MTVQQALEAVIIKLGKVHPSVEDFNAVAVPVYESRNMLIDILNSILQQQNNAPVEEKPKEEPVHDEQSKAPTEELPQE